MFYLPICAPGVGLREAPVFLFSHCELTEALDIAEAGISTLQSGAQGVLQ